MLSSLLLVLCLNTPAALPTEVRATLESQLPAWAALTGNAAAASSSEERFAVERTEGAVLHVYLIDRKIQATIRREEGKSWLTEATWCGQGEGRCDVSWSRSDDQWRSDKNTANHTGYAVFRDSLSLPAVNWTESVPALVAGKKKWDKGLCRDGLCFLASAKDSSVAFVAARQDASILWWDASYILGGALEKDLLHAWKLLLDKGRALTGK
ncbi:MAG: hypothetical protein RL318_3064 [Fibrobacterota bacterium]|jgi:hypothetical protein